MGRLIYGGADEAKDGDHEDQFEEHGNATLIV
jgi:hypothetical protein